MEDQKGVSLIITFLIMTIMLSMVLSMVTIIMNQFKVMINKGDSVSSFNAAETGLEKTFYLALSSPQIGQPSIAAGFCGICSTCQTSTNDCNTTTDFAPQGCSLTPLDGGGQGCTIGVCDNCNIKYSTLFDGRRADVETTVTGSTFTIYSTGYYNNVKRTSYFDSSN